jgi:hypothetical protein
MKTLYIILRNRIVVGLAPGLKKIQLVSILVAGSETLSMGDHGFDLFVNVLDAWRPRCSLGSDFVLTILYFCAKKPHMNM